MDKTPIDALVAFLNNRLDEDEWWAREASRNGDEAGTPAGNHWRWEDTEYDQVLTLDPSQYEVLGEESQTFKVSLRSEEQYPSSSGPLPHFAIGYAEEVTVVVGGHIARHDPARVLLEVEAKRRTVADHAHIPGDGINFTSAEQNRAEDLLRNLSSIYRDHPDYQDEWRPLG